jgi:hypothetical protein
MGQNISFSNLRVADNTPSGMEFAAEKWRPKMLSNWYMEELQKAILGYRETIAALEDIKRNVKPFEKNSQWGEAAEARIRHLKQSITALQNILGSTLPENSGDVLKF